MTTVDSIRQAEAVKAEKLLAGKTARELKNMLDGASCPLWLRRYAEAAVQTARVAQVERVLSSWDVEGVRVDVEEHTSEYVLVIGATRQATSRALAVLQEAGFVTMYEMPDVFGVYFGATS